MAHAVTVESPAMPRLLGKPALVFYSLSGEERLSELYDYDIVLKTPPDPAIAWQSASNLDLKSLVGKEMTVRIPLDGMGDGSSKDVREISGIVTQARYLERDANQALYAFKLAPWLSLATLTSDYRIFQNQDVPAILRDVLADYDYPVDVRLTETYPALEYQVQYGETDFDFMQRLMQEWGIYWFFEHAEGVHRLVLVDQVNTHKRFPVAAYHDLYYYPPDAKVDREYVSDFKVSEGLQPGQWVTSDYDFKKSRASLRTVDKKPRSTSHNTMELYQWPGDYDDPATGEKLARVRMEAAGAPGSRSDGFGNLRAVVCGCTFALHQFPYEKANRDYLVLGASLTLRDNGQTSGQQTYACGVHFDVQPASKVYRPEQNMRKPYTHGPQTAIVVGPAGEEVWTDEYGRVKVAFHWDRYARQDEHDSCWIRVSQAWAGAGFGGMYIPRVGQEVIVDFMNGDPDRPVIIGNLYNNVTQPPWKLPENATKSGMVSHTVKGEPERQNAMRFDDEPGQEEFRMQAERDMNTLVKRNLQQNVRSDKTQFIGGNNLNNVVGNSSMIVGGASATNVGAFHSLNVAGASAVSVGTGRSVNVGGTSAHNVGGAYTMSVGMGYNLQVGAMVNIICGSAILSMSADGAIALAGRAVTISATDSLTLVGNTVNINPENPPPPPPRVPLPAALAMPPGLDGSMAGGGIVSGNVLTSGVFPFT